MNDERMQELMRRQAEGMRAMTEEEMYLRQLDMARGSQQREPSSEQEAIRNFWYEQNSIPNESAATLFDSLTFNLLV